MSDISIANSIFTKLVADATFLDYHGLTTASTNAQKAVKIQKEMEPDGLTIDNIPLTCIYPIPGLRSKLNHLVYDAMFEITHYSSSSVGVKSATQKAGTMVMGARAKSLIHQIQLAGATFKVEFQSSFQSNSNVPGIKKYTQRFKISEELPE